VVLLQTGPKVLNVNPHFATSSRVIGDAGAVVAILPELADTPGINWSKPLAGWPRETTTPSGAMRVLKKSTPA
jgi:hypothetical protein